VVLDVSVQPFAHGQLYTALSRVRCEADLAIVVEEEVEGLSDGDSGEVSASNIMWTELLHA
jgi:hypothetical protein